MSESDGHEGQIFGEAVGSQSQLHGALEHGIDVLSLEQDITFQSYSRWVLPLDGYVFWIPSAKQTFQGSLHYAQEIVQEEDETYGLATVRFTTRTPITEFETAPTNKIWVARRGKFRFAFSQQTGFYHASGIWHYFGHSIAPAMASQLVDLPGQIDPKQAVVSNSLPAWLSLNSYSPVYEDWFKNSVTLYPSFAVPPNLVPPYGVVHIEPSKTRALQSVPLITQDRSHYQLASDTVRITLYGLQNNAACDFLDAVLQYSGNGGAIGLMNTPIIRDEKRKQNELEALAMKKVIDFEVSYYQARMQSISRKLITEAVIEYIVNQFQVNSVGLPPIPNLPQRISLLVKPPPIYTEDTVVMQTPGGLATVVVSKTGISMSAGGVTVTIDATGVNVVGGPVNVPDTTVTAEAVVTENLDVTE